MADLNDDAWRGAVVAASQVGEWELAATIAEEHGYPALCLKCGDDIGEWQLRFVYDGHQERQVRDGFSIWVCTPCYRSPTPIGHSWNLAAGPRDGNRW